MARTRPTFSTVPLHQNLSEDYGLAMNDKATLIYKWLANQVDCHWLDQQLDKVSSATGLQETLFTSIGLAPRKVGKVDLQLTEADMVEANRLSAGWDPTDYSVDLAARLCLLLRAAEHGAQFEAVFDFLWRTADVAEQVAFYRGLSLYPNPERYLWRATDGCRTNIKGVFEAIAHRNPYPAQHFDEVAFNQLCLKALFVVQIYTEFMALSTDTIQHSRA